MTSAPEVRRWRRGFSTLGCAELDLPAVVALAQQCGIHELELRALVGRLDLPAYFAEHDPGLPRSRALLAAAGCRVRILDTSVRLLDGPAGLDALRAFAGLAQALGAPYLRVFDGGEAAHPPTTAAGWAPALALLEAWDAERLRQGWDCALLIETHGAWCTSGPVLDLVQRCPRPLGVLWDAHHTWLRGAEDPVATWRAIGHLVRHLHIKDSLPGKPVVHCPPGRGDFPLATVLGLLDQAGFAGVASLEWERLWHPELAPLAEVLPIWAAWRSSPDDAVPGRGG